MKKNLFKTLIGVLVFMFGMNVYAATAPNRGGEILEGNAISNGVSGSATVGEIATPVYVVSIIWDDLTFDWVYDGNTDAYNWKAADLCQEEYELWEGFDEKLEEGRIFTDATCSTVTYEKTEENEYYSVTERTYASITIQDLSQNGQIVPSIKWNSSDEYGYTSATFKVGDTECVEVSDEDVYSVAKEYGTVLYSDAACSTKAIDSGFAADKYYVLAFWKNYSKLNTEEISDSFRQSGYTYIEELNLSLDASGDYEDIYDVRLTLDVTEQPSKTPTPGSTIGTVTVSFRTK